MSLSVGDHVKVTEDRQFLRDVFEQSESLTWQQRFAGLAGMVGRVENTRFGEAQINVSGHPTLWIPEFVLEKTTASVSELASLFESSSRRGPPRVGMRVRVKPSVSSPKYGWGSVTESSVGTLKSIDGSKCTVNFPEQSDWLAALDEVEEMPSSSAASAGAGAGGAAPALSIGSSGFSIGTRVCVSKSCTTPSYGWGSVSHGFIGIISSLSSSNVTIDFPKHKSWMGKQDELQVLPPLAVGNAVQVTSDRKALSEAFSENSSVSSSETKMGLLGAVGTLNSIRGHAVFVKFPRVRDPLSFPPLALFPASAAGASSSSVADNVPAVGAKVRVKPGVVPSFGWGSVSASSVGTLKAITGPNKCTIDFPEQSNWAGQLSELEVIREKAPVVVGARVHVKPGIEAPKYGWGRIDSSSIGTVTKIAGSIITIDFPSQTGWSGDLSELETVEDGSGASTSPFTSSKPISVGARVMVDPTLSSPAYGWGSVKHGDVGTVVELRDSNTAYVDFPRHTRWAGKPSELVLVGASMTSTDAAPLTPGSSVRVKPGVTPSHGWGSVTASSVGIVVSIASSGRCVINFPEQSEWSGVLAELEAVGPSGGGGRRGSSAGAAAGAGTAEAPVYTTAAVVSTGSQVRFKATVAVPSCGWATLTHASVGKVLSLPGGGRATIRFGSSEHSCLIEEVEALPTHPSVPSPPSRPGSVAGSDGVPVPPVGKAILRRALSTSDECVVCLEATREVTLVHGSTGHRCCCADCAEDLTECPMCREKIDMVVKTFD